ncbi:hypothetical protein PPERSA_03999 [Pseudocohnilembus persalinus]|uniref:Uncharacterized protein n=1 Tax=Pseudocohnilembus persalinus TaxID=266149 RepID=A0A0V0QBD1_PSEPJ|nr:hypothetical protein PPERSA_03999 [Pseudocohnilembus persalinus]|eukprot:KRW99529.1 hypothetical protein PPERSA_03999 [Pseudocohnilembus persalinus]
MKSVTNNSFIQEEEEEEFEDEYFQPIATIRDYKYIYPDIQKIDIKYLDIALAKQFFQPNTLTGLKMTVYNCDKGKFSELTTFIDYLLQNQQIQELYLNFSDYHAMTDADLEKLYLILSQYIGKLKILQLNLNNWGQDNENITEKGCLFLGQIIGSQQNLVQLSLLCTRWGMNNTKINDKAIQNLMEGLGQLTKLQQLELNLQSWGCQKYSSLGHISDEGINFVALALFNLQQLTNLDLNLRSWGYQNKKVTNKSLFAIGDSLKQINQLNKLHLNLYCWGYENDQITGEGVQHVMSSINNHYDLEDININFEGWGLDQKKKRNLVNISNNTVQDMFGYLQQYEKLKKFSINLNSWGWKNDTISNQSLKRIGTFLQERGQNLESLELSLKMWYNNVDQINHDGIDTLSQGLQNCRNLKKMYLNLECMGFKNPKIDNNCIKQIAAPLHEMKNLEELHLLLECWGVEDKENLGIVCDEDIKNIIDPIQEMRNLKILNLNFNSWGYKNNKITDKAVQIISDCISNLAQNLISLEIHLKNWGYFNRAIKNNSLDYLQRALLNLKELQYLKLDIDNWGDGNPYIHVNAFEKLLQSIQQLPYITELQFLHKIQDWDLGRNDNNQSKIDKQIETMLYLIKNLNDKIKFNKNLIIANQTVLQYYSHIFRREMIYDIAENLVI